MTSPGISRYFDYRASNVWLADLEIDFLTVMAQNSLMGETLSDTIIRVARSIWASSPIKPGVEMYADRRSSEAHETRHFLAVRIGLR